MSTATDKGLKATVLESSSQGILPSVEFNFRLINDAGDRRLINDAGDFRLI